MLIYAVIPAKNEEKTIGAMVDELFELNKKHKFGQLRILVVSDSTDNTMEEARKHGAEAMRGNGRGLGDSMYCGLKEAVARGAEMIFTIDADAQFDPQELPGIITPVLEGKADLVLGSRFLEKGLVEYDMPFLKRVGNGILSFMIRKITGFDVTDAQTGYRAMTWEVADKLEMIGTHTYVQETIIDAVKKNFRVIEVPAKFRKREVGTSKVVGSIKRYALWTFPVLVLHSGMHMVVFPVIGALLICGGMLGFAFVFYSEGFEVARLFARMPALLLISLLILTGMQMFFFGLLVNSVSTLSNKLNYLNLKRRER